VFLKVFVIGNPEAAEPEVNAWLAENPVTLKHVTQSQCERQGKFLLTISVFYEMVQQAAGNAHAALRRSQEYR
jgi:hypothetical protein